MSDEPSDLLTVSQICRRLPGARGGRRLHPSTVTRWVVRGLPSRDGTPVRLVATRAGGRWLIRQSDLDSFFARLAGPSPDDLPAPPRTPSERQRASELASKRLDEMGY